MTAVWGVGGLLWCVGCKESLEAAIYFLHPNLRATRCWPKAPVTPVIRRITEKLQFKNTFILYVLNL